MDWPGLLKFSLQNTDGTSKSKFEEMNQQTKKWLEQAILHYSQSEVKRITQILKEISKPELNSKEDESQRVTLLEELEELIETLGQGDTLYALNGHISVMKIIFSSQYTSNRVIAARIFCFANQNDAKVQTQSINTGAFEVLQRIDIQEQLAVKEAMIGCLSSLVRGENLESKRILIQIKGLDVLQHIILKPLSQRMKDKANNILRDLLHYDNHLHKTFNNLSSFANTNSLKGPSHHTDLHYDVNKSVQDNLLQKNKIYEGYIARWLKQRPEVEIKHNQWIKSQI